eukprot:COSAG06_NODE_47303_length_340_cov_0.721992_1_plen_58_part_01
MDLHVGVRAAQAEAQPAPEAAQGALLVGAQQSLPVELCPDLRDALRHLQRLLHLLAGL